MYVAIEPRNLNVAGCHDAVGQWGAAWVVSDAGVSPAAGRLQVGEDGRSRVDTEFAGNGPVGRFRARGRIDLDDGSVLLVDQLEDSPAAVTGTCRVDGRLLACFVHVDGVEYELWFRRD